jgi:hypothetical protein
MSQSWRDAVSRRPILASLGALVGVGFVGAAIYEAPELLRGRPARRGYDDLLSQLGDPESANRLGAQVLIEAEVFEPQVAARELRHRLKHAPFQAVLAADLAEGRIVETGGWVLPESLALLCGLAAKLG